MNALRKINPTILWLIGGLLAVTAGFYVVEQRGNNAVEETQAKFNHTLQRTQIEGCRRGNLQRAYELANKSDGREAV